MLSLLLALLIDVVLTVAATLLVRWRFGSVAAVIVGALTVPALLAAFAYWAVTRPNPGHVDGPGMLVAALVGLEPILILIGLAVSLLTVFCQSKLPARNGGNSSDPSR